MKTIKIFGIHPDYKGIDSFLTEESIKSNFSEFQFIWTSDKPDYLIVSEVIYTNKRFFKQYLKLRKISSILIFIGAEAVLPDLNIFDYAIVYDSQLSYGDRIVQFPARSYEYLSPNSKFENNLINKEDADDQIKLKTRFANFLYSNAYSNQFRDQFFWQLSKYKKVNSIGKHLNNTTLTSGIETDWIKESINIKRNYKFSLAIENSIMPGYTTEKIYTSLIANTVPIYWGNPEIAEDINPDSFINLHSFKDIEEAIHHILLVDKDTNLFRTMLMAPWKNKDQKLNDIIREKKYIEFWRRILSQQIKDAKRIPEGTFNYFYTSFYNRIYLFNSFKLLVILGKIKKLLKISIQFFN